MAGIKRVFIIVLDSFGIGNEPDAADFGDGKCNTLASLTTSPELHAPNLTKLGLFNIDGVGCGTPADSPIGAFARLRELSRGKDTTIGHWEIAGIVSEQPMPTYPNGFPPEILARLSAACDGKKILCNKPYSGTQVIHDYGREQEETGGLIVYTSADSVLQIAANEADVPVERLYDYCRAAREIMQGEHGVGRIIARPYVGSYPNYKRTAHRHDFSLDPTGDTMMDALVRKGCEVIGVGKISDIFAGRRQREQRRRHGKDAPHPAGGLHGTVLCQPRRFRYGVWASARHCRLCARDDGVRRAARYVHGEYARGRCADDHSGSRLRPGRTRN